MSEPRGKPLETYFEVVIRADSEDEANEFRELATEYVCFPDRIEVHEVAK